MNGSNGIDGSRHAADFIDNKDSLPEKSKAKWHSREASPTDVETELTPNADMDRVDYPILERSARFSTLGIDSGRDSLSSDDLDSESGSLSLGGREHYGSIDDGFVEETGASSLPLNLESAVLSKELGSGRFGKVYLVEQDIDNKRTCYFALKTAQGDSREEKEANLAKLKHEVEVLEVLGVHPNIVECGGFAKVDQEEGVLFGLIQGPDLSGLNNKLCEQFEKGDITLHELSDTLAFLEQQKLDAMLYLQEANRIHGDLKASNFMWDSESKLLKLIDFGQSASCAGDGRVVCGHEDYTPPEAIDSLQGSAHAVKANIAIDNYALGQMQFMMHDYLLGGKGHAFSNGAKTEGLAPSQRTEKAFLFRQAMKAFTTPKEDGSYQKVIEDVSFDELMMQISEKDQPATFDPLYDKATEMYEKMQVLKPMADYACRFMHPIAEHRATAQEMMNHPWIINRSTDIDRIENIIAAAAA